MKVKPGILLFVLVFLSFNSTLKASEISFASRFNLIKKHGYFLPSKKTNSLMIKKDEEGNPGKICIINDKKLKAQNNLMLFYIQTDTCSACSVELWLYNESQRPSIVQLDKLAGNNGNPPTLLEFISHGKNHYFLFKHTNMAQGVEESTLDLIKYNLEDSSTVNIFRSYLSDTSFLGKTERCSGWRTSYKLDLELGKITFLKKGHACIIDWPDIVDKSRNGKKVFKEDSINLN